MQLLSPHLLVPPKTNRLIPHCIATCILLLPGQTMAKPELANPVPKLSTTLTREVSKEPYTFQSICDLHNANTVGNAVNMSTSRELPPALSGKCIVTGDQNQATAVCLCADQDQAITQAVDGASIPSFHDPDHDPEIGVFAALSELCQERFNTICGPFPRTIKNLCKSDHGSCSYRFRGYQKNGAYEALDIDCSCNNRRAFSLQQSQRAPFEMQSVQASELCRGALNYCEAESKPIFDPLLLLSPLDHGDEQLECSRKTEARDDHCRIQKAAQGQAERYLCVCNETEHAGKLPGAGGHSTLQRWDACQGLLDRCSESGSEGKNNPWKDEDDQTQEEKSSPGFEVSCGLSGYGSLDVSSGQFVSDGLVPPEKAGCVLFGDKTNPRYLCLCSDLAEPLSGKIDPKLIPDLNKPEQENSTALHRLCETKLHTTCGPFAKPLKQACENAKGNCALYMAGHHRNDDFDIYDAHCRCEDGRSMRVSQRHRKSFGFERGSAGRVCKDSLRFCEPGGNPVFQTSQRLAPSNFVNEDLRCARQNGKYVDQCTILSEGEGTTHRYECMFGQSDGIYGVLNASEESGVVQRWNQCQDLLDRSPQGSQGKDKKDSQSPESKKQDPESGLPEPENNPHDPEHADPGSTHPMPGKGKPLPGPLPKREPGNNEVKSNASGCRNVSPHNDGFRSLLSLGFLLAITGLRRRRVFDPQA